MNATTSDPSPPTLDYRHRPRLSVVGRHRKKLIFLALCIAIGVPLYRNWATLKHRVLWVYWAHRAAAHQMPPQPFERVIIDPTRAKAAVAANSDYLMSGSVAIYAPLAYRRLVELDPRIPKAPGSILFADLVFMGTMPQPDGTPRLVIVIEDIMYGAGITPTIFLFPLPRWTDPLPAATKATLFPGRGFTTPWGGGFDWPHPSGAFTATLDPSHSSYMTIVTEFPPDRALGTRANSATMPTTVTVHRTNLYLMDDGRFLKSDAYGKASVTTPLMQPPLPGLGKP